MRLDQIRILFIDLKVLKNVTGQKTIFVEKRRLFLGTKYPNEFFLHLFVPIIDHLQHLLFKVVVLGNQLLSLTFFHDGFN
jgi:hypothetical protein